MRSQSSPTQFETPEQIRQAHASAIEGLRANREMSDEAKRVQIARVHVGAKAALEELRQRNASSRAAARTDLMRRAFSYGHEKNLYANDEHRTAAKALHRDAVARVADVDDPRQLSQLLEQANDLGDESLARAVGYRAHKIGARDVLQTYAAPRKNQGQALQELYDLPADPIPLDDVIQHVVPKPKEIESMNDTGIQQLAQTNMGTSSAE